MTRKELKSHNYERKDIRVPGKSYVLPCFFCKIGDEWFVIAKSVVHAVTDNILPYKKDPYIDRIMDVCAQDFEYFNVKDNKIISAIWTERTPVTTPKLIHVKVTTLLTKMDEIFYDIDADNLEDAKQKIKKVFSDLS